MIFQNKALKKESYILYLKYLRKFRFSVLGYFLLQFINPFILPFNHAVEKRFKWLFIFVKYR